MRSIYNIQDIELSKSDTATPELLKKFDVTFKKYSQHLYSIDNWAAKCAHDYTSNSIDNVGNPKEIPNQYHEFKYLCHHPFDAANKGTNGVLNVFTKCMRPSAREYLEYILSDDGPYAEGLKHTIVIRDKSNDGHPMGTVLINTAETPIQVYTNYQIAGRLISGWALDIFWHRLVSLGFNKEVSLMASTLHQWGNMRITAGGYSSYSNRWGTEPEKTQQLTRNGPAVTDQPFSSNKPSFSPRRLMDKRPDFKGTLKDGTKPNPCNCIWEDDETCKRRGKRNAFIKSDDFPFWKAYMGVKTYTKQEIAKIEDDLYSESPDRQIGY